jgi:hypothetical protein
VTMKAVGLFPPFIVAGLAFLAFYALWIVTP